MKHTCILGSGICGLTAAWKEEQKGNRVTIIDSSAQVGGVIESHRKEGFLLDYGPNTLSLRLRSTDDFLQKTGILKHAIDANQQANKRFIVRDETLVALPQGFTSFLTSKFLSPKGKLRLLLEPFLPRGTHDPDESVASFVSRRLGKEALQYAANPFLAGVYAAKPETLCLRHAFPGLLRLEKEARSLFLGIVKGIGKSQKIPSSRLLSFPEGLKELPKRLSTVLQGTILLEHSVTQVRKIESGWKITASNSDGTIHEQSFDEIICTIPAHKLQTIQWLNIEKEEEIAKLSNAQHFPLSLVYLGFNRSDVSHALDGFGFLVPECEKKDILGTLFSSTLFPDRAPPDKVLLTTFVGGERNPDLALLDEDSLCRIVFNQLSPLLGICAEPVFQHVKTWKQAIPLPDASLGDRKKASQKLHLANPGLLFSGSHLTGPPLPSCLDAA